MPPFAAIKEAALARHGEAGLEARLVSPNSAAGLRAVTDDRYLSAMQRRIFRAGLKHSLVDAKWPAFEEVFAGFDIDACARIYDETLEECLADRRLIRHLPKLRSIRDNAGAMRRIRDEHGGVGAWLAAWPASDVVGLWADLTKRFSQLGGNSGPNFLRMVGKDTFIPTDHVLHALSHWQAHDDGAKSKAARGAIQRVFNQWAVETGLPLCQLSQILAMSVAAEDFNH
jgi:3-methyladenine DNA glycosylase Tag